VFKLNGVLVGTKYFTINLTALQSSDQPFHQAYMHVSSYGNLR